MCRKPLMCLQKPKSLWATWSLLADQPGQCPGGSPGDEWLAPDGMNFIWCPPGEYMMGDPAFYDAQPVSISIDQGFWISKFELTRLDASTERMNAGGSFTYGRQPMHPAGALRLEMLVEQIHKKQAPKGWTYDLPSEAEWEYAARAGSKAGLPAPIEKLGQFANFADRSLFDANEEVHFIFAHREIDDGTAHGFSNIGRYLPNAWGIHDMFGNASEYCAGYYAEEFSGKVNYHLKSSRDRGIAILRGGAWCTPVKHLHVAYRTSYNGDENQPYSGARLVIRQGKRITVTHAELVAKESRRSGSARQGMNQLTRVRRFRVCGCPRVGISVVVNVVAIVITLVVGSAQADEKPFVSTVTPFLKTYCIDCHSVDNAEGGIQLDHLHGRFNDRREASVCTRLSSPSVPPLARLTHSHKT